MRNLNLIPMHSEWMKEVKTQKTSSEFICWHYVSIFTHLVTFSECAGTVFLTVNSIWGGGTTPLRSRKPLDIWPWNFYQMSNSVRRHEIRKKIWHNLTGLVSYRPKSRKTRFLEMQLLGMLTSRNFAGLSLLTSEINPENFRSIS